ncbi:acetyl-coenzyme A synthetase [Thermopolyspora flexuosa]|uniref:Acetyl-coenzyme A synthetase n=1 Tax=Thermopolyspora flexuosa TaxID=103836 RepID=A0A543J3M7_9ACTN|nr:acetate--CoA ligase [Thermopolyspora flexuosa]TQM77424.1 acetyl-coenzyme A synthetase [Thermopolyspora flexuosa]GGM73396.1 acetyl-coenzyme A synthetase [Thermopolyspora flexuosa]
MAPDTPGRQTQETLSNLLQETRRFDPPADLAAQANVKADAYEEAAADRLKFWEQAAERLDWAERWHTVLEWNPPFAKWFLGGKLNVAYNCVDRHVEAGKGDKVAYYWEGEPEGHSRVITYADLQREVNKTANALLELGVRKGDRVAIYLPMIPELPISMLACARIGAIHSVVFGGFSASALEGRIKDADAKIVITADGGFRRGKPNALKPTVDEALANCPGVERVVVVKRTGEDVPFGEKDIWWHDLVDRQSDKHEAEPHDAEDPLYILYTSGTTGKPKGILHTTGGYLTQVAWTHWAVFDLKPETDIYWCTADIGWVTGHSYIVYGPLANGATSVIYEGTPDTPHRGRFWEIVQKYKVTICYTAPTAIRTFMKWGDDIPAKFDMSSLRVLGSVGEPINPEAYVWYREHIGGNRCPVVDTWWQTETGAIMITPLPGVTSAKPGAAMRPLPGIVADVVDDTGQSVPNGGGGFLVIKEPWPSMLRTIWGDDQRYIDTYWSRFPGMYFPGDGAKKDEDGDLWLLGRVDDVMLVSGHNISTTEVESALVSHPKVAEAAVVGATDPVTGQAIVAFVILRGDAGEGPELAKDLRDHVAKTLGPIAKPRQILVVPELPKTRSGKIMRRLLRDVAENRSLGDVTTLTDSSVMDLIKQKLPTAKSED